MSGRLYDLAGIPKCNTCKKDCLRSDERNFNGTYCKKCEETSDVTYNIDHPLWKKYIFFLDQFKGKLVNFEEVSFKNFKKEHEFSS